jgi:UDP-N-acetylmuramate-alanine ligase
MPAMHIHILGICGTFMGGLAAIARSASSCSRATAQTSSR